MAFSTQVLRSLLESAERLRIPREDLLSQMADARVLESERAWISNEAFYRILLRAMELSPEPGLGLRIGGHGHFTAFGAVGLLMAVVPTFREAVTTMARFHRVARDQQDVFVQFDSRELAVEYRLFDAEGPVRVCLSEIVLVNLSLLLRQYGGVGGAAARVELDFPAPAHASEYPGVFGCEVAFECSSTRLIVSRELAERRQLLHHPEVASDLRKRAEAQLFTAPLPTLETRVREQLRSAWGSGAPTMHAIARGLGMSQRSLHRHLARHGIDYRTLLDQTRCEAALALLRNRLSVKYVAHELGFSRTTAFHRAFKRWMGCTPLDYALLHGKATAADRAPEQSG